MYWLPHLLSCLNFPFFLSISCCDSCNCLSSSNSFHMYQQTIFMNQTVSSLLAFILRGPLNTTGVKTLFLGGHAEAAGGCFLSKKKNPQTLGVTASSPPLDRGDPSLTCPCPLTFAYLTLHFHLKVRSLEKHLQANPVAGRPPAPSPRTISSIMTGNSPFLCLLPDTAPVLKGTQVSVIWKFTQVAEMNSWMHGTGNNRYKLCYMF